MTVAQAAAGPEAVARAPLHHPDVAVLDLQMPGLDGITGTELLAALPASSASEKASRD